MRRRQSHFPINSHAAAAAGHHAGDSVMVGGFDIQGGSIAITAALLSCTDAPGIRLMA